MELKQKIIFIISFFLILGGRIIIIDKAYPPLSESEFLSSNFNCNNLLVCNEYPITFTKKDQNGKIISTISGVMHFNSIGAFSVNNRINYEINLDVMGSVKIDKIYFLISQSGEDLSYIKKIKPNELLERAKIGTILDINLCNGYFLTH